MNIQTILVPTDFSKDAEKALSTGIELARAFEAKLVILHAYQVLIPLASPLQGGYALPDGFYQELRAQAKSEVERLAKQAEAEGVEATGIALETTPTIGIVEESDRISADLVVMGTRGLTGIKHIAFGSVAERVVRTAKCPVLTVKADEADA